MTKQDKVEKVMHEWKAGTLTSHGKVVTDYDQAVAIALSEAGLSKKYAKGGWVLYDEDDEKLIKVYETESEARKNLYEYEGNANIVKKSSWDNNQYAKGGGVGLDNFDALDLPISYRLINNKGEVIFKTNSFNKASDTRTIKSFEGEGKLKIIATDKSGNQKIISDGIDEDGKKYEKGGNMNKYARGGAVDAPKIYVADLEAYNNGKLVGEWLDLSDFEDGKDVSREISKLLKKWGAEEYAIHDVENVPSSIYSEYMGEEDFDKIIKIYKASEENDLPYEVISEIMLQYEPEDLEEWISDHYEGHFDNDTDLAYSVVENAGGVSDLGKKTTEMYFDYEGFGRDLEINDEWEGDFDSDEDRGYDYVENMGGVSELGDKTIDMYFDYEKFGRDLAINDYTEIEDGYYFRTPRYAKGGLTNERRYVNKSQDYETRYAKDRLKRTGYKSERKFAVGGGIDSDEAIETYVQYKSVILERVGNNIYLTINGKTWKLTKSQLNELLEELEEYSNPLTASEFLMDIDKSKYENITSNKYAVGGEIGNTVSFKGDYGKPRSGVIKEKRGSSYIVGTDDGDRLVDSYEVIGFSETPVAKKKRFGFFEGGGSIESKKQAILEFINSFPDKPKNWSEATDDLPELHYDIAEQYGSKYDFDFNKRSSLRDRNLRHKQHAKSLLNKLSDEEISNVYSKWEETLEDKYEGGGEIENKIEKLKKVVSSKMINETARALAITKLAELEKQLHESKETKAEEKAEHKAGGSEYGYVVWEDGTYRIISKHPTLAGAEKYAKELADKNKGEIYHFGSIEKYERFKAEEGKSEYESKLDEKEELNATIQKLYGIESKAEDLINYQSGGIQGQSVDKIKKYVEYVNKEVSKLNVPFGSEVYDVLEDENAHSLNLTLGLLGFYKNAKDSGEWAKKHEQYAKVVDVVNEVKGGGKPEAKKPTTIKFGNITFTIDSAELENGGDVYGGHIDIYNRIIKGFPYNYKTAKEVEERMKSYIKGIKSATYHGSKGRESQKLPYLVIFNDGQAEIKEKFETAKEALNFHKVLDSVVNSNNPSKPTTKKPTTISKKEVVGYAIVDPISGEIVVSKKTIRQLIEASKKLEKTKGFEDMGDLAYEIIKKDDKNVLGDKIESVDIKSLPIGKKPTTRKAPVKKAVVKKTVAKKVEVKKVVKGDLPKSKFEKGDKVGVSGHNEVYEIKDKSYRNNIEGELTWVYYLPEYSSVLVSEKNLKVIPKPKADHKKLVAKLKAKKGGKEYDNRASLVPFTDKRRERSESSDKKRSALPPGKRVSENGVTYYENRLNRTDLSKKDKFEKGGEVKGSDWGLNLNW